jgi:hypothetical protein
MPRCTKTAVEDARPPGEVAIMRIAAGDYLWILGRGFGIQGLLDPDRPDIASGKGWT